MPTEKTQSVRCNTTIGAWIIIGLIIFIILAIGFAIWKHKMILNKLVNNSISVIDENKPQIQELIDDFTSNTVENLGQSPEVLAIMQPDSNIMTTLKSTFTEYILDLLESDSKVMIKLETALQKMIQKSINPLTLS